MITFFPNVRGKKQIQVINATFSGEIKGKEKIIFQDKGEKSVFPLCPDGINALLWSLPLKKLQR